MDAPVASDSHVLRESLIDLGIDGWRFARLFGRVLSKLDAGEGSRFASQHRYYLKRLEESLQAAGMRIVSIEGHSYDPGIAASALNLGEFGPDDSLVVEHMVEPIIMGPDGLLRAGTVTLRKVGE